MFDLSFGKLILVMVIALIVLGPERLPKAIKTVASWIKTLRRLSATVQLELNKELKLQELQDSLQKAQESGLDKITPEIKASIDDLKRTAQSIQQEFYTTTEQVNSTIKQMTDGIKPVNASTSKPVDQIAPPGDPVGKDDHAR